MHTVWQYILPSFTVRDNKVKIDSQTQFPFQIKAFPVNVCMHFYGSFRKLEHCMVLYGLRYIHTNLKYIREVHQNRTQTNVVKIKINYVGTQRKKSCIELKIL